MHEREQEQQPGTDQYRSYRGRINACQSLDGNNDSAEALTRTLLLKRA